MGAIRDLRDTVAAEITDRMCDGVRVVVDPRNVNAPCVIVDVPTITLNATAGRCAITAQIPIRAVAPPPGNADAVAWLLDTVEAVMRAVAATDAVPSFVEIGTQELPAYTMTVTRSTRIN